jgi:hypothetical protein
MDLGAILIALFTVGVVKLSVMFLAARLVLKLYSASYLSHKSEKLWLLIPDEDLPEVRVLWWSLVLFAFSELACGVEVYIILQSNPVVASVHAITSGVGTAFFAYGMYLFVDRKFLHYGADRCLANRICKGCTISDPSGCKFRVTLLMVATLLVMASWAAFLAPTDRIYADMKNWALPFSSLNAWFDSTVVPWLLANVPSYDPTGKAFFIPHAELWVEFRLLPGIALLMGVGAIGLILKAREHIGIKMMVAAGGLLGYVFLEIFLYGTTQDALIGSLGHELVELWFLLTTAEFLIRVYHPPEEISV